MLKITVKNPNAKQFQMEYALYMMLTSYFKSAKCSTKTSERKLFLYYADLTDSKQVDLEKQVIMFIERTLIPAILPRIYRLDSKDLAELDTEVTIRCRGDHHAFEFTGSDFHFTLVCKREGNRFVYRLSR